MATRINHEIVLKNVRLSYPLLDEARFFAEAKKNPTKKTRYKATLILDEKTQLDQLKAAQAVMLAARDEGFSAKERSGVKLPLRKGDEEGYADKAGYGPGTRFIGASNDKKPRVVNMQREDIDPLKAYAGCYVNAKVRFYTGTWENTKRVCSSIEVVQFYRDGEAFGAGPASLDDLPEEAAGDTDVRLDDDLGL